MDQVKDTEAKDKILDAQIFEVEDLDIDIVNTMDSHVVTVAMMPPPKVIGGTASSSATPKCLTTSVSKKQSFIPVTIPIQVMVVKYTEKGPKKNKFKTTARLDADEETGRWVDEIASYNPKDENKEVNAKDFEITKVELKNMSRDLHNHLFQVSTKKMFTRLEKDGQEERELKQHVKILAQFIDSIGCFGTLPISHASESFDPTTLENKELMGQVQQAKNITGAVEKWIEGVIKDGEKYITSSKKSSNEMQSLIAEIQNQIVSWENEEHKWENVLPMLTKIEEYEAAKFLARNSIKLVIDECQLFVLKKTIMWWVLTFKFVIFDARYFVNEL